MASGRQVAPEVKRYEVAYCKLIAMPGPLRAGHRHRDRCRLDLRRVLECLHVTGADSCLFTVVARDMADLEQFFGSINKYGETRTSIVMSSQIPRRGVQRF